MTCNVSTSREKNEDLLPTRRSLISRLKNHSDQQSWGAFFDVYSELIYLTALKAGLSKADAEDVVQETVICVSKAIPGFRYDPRNGSFRGWLLRMTHRRIQDYYRKTSKHPRSEMLPSDPEHDADSRVDTLAVDPELERIWQEEWEATLLRGAIERAKRRVDPKNYQLFELSVLQHWPLKKICSVLHVRSTRVYLARFRISRLVNKELQYLKTAIC